LITAGDTSGVVQYMITISARDRAAYEFRNVLDSPLQVVLIGFAIVRVDCEHVDCKLSRPQRYPPPVVQQIDSFYNTWCAPEVVYVPRLHSDVPSLRRRLWFYLEDVDNLAILGKYHKGVAAPCKRDMSDRPALRSHELTDEGRV
jgi:hypothetical protein